MMPPGRSLGAAAPRRRRGGRDQPAGCLGGWPRRRRRGRVALAIARPWPAIAGPSRRRRSALAIVWATAPGPRRARLAGRPRVRRRHRADRGPHRGLRRHRADRHQTARVVATLAATAGHRGHFHLLLALPDGRLVRPARRIAGRPGYVSAVGTGAGLAVADQPFGAGGRVRLAARAAGALRPSGCATCRRPGATASGCSGSGSGRAVAADGGPGRRGAPRPGRLARTGSARWPPAPPWPAPARPLVLAEWPAAGAYGGRVLVHACRSPASPWWCRPSTWSSSSASARRRTTRPTARSSGCPMLAAAIAAAGLSCRPGTGWSPRPPGSSTARRQAPDEVLRTFGSRLTRAMPMDELLLQLAESLRKTMALTSAEVYTGTGDVLERAVSVPDADPGPSSCPTASGRWWPGPACRATPGSSVWLPALLEGREHAQLRVAPISHAGELLGLIVVERPERADTFSEEDDRVLTDLARQVGLAFHNVQLDAALQTTLDELREPGRRTARVPGPHRGQRRRRAPPGRAQPARRRPAAPGGPGRQPPAGPGHRRRGPGGRGRDAGPAGRRGPGHHPGAPRAGPRDLSAAAGRQRPGRRAPRQRPTAAR